MALRTAVNLPRAHQVSFPNRCVVCGLESPGSTVRVISTSVGWWTWFTWFFGRPHVVKAPACKRCGWWLHANRLLGTTITVAIIAAMYFYVWPHFENAVPRPMRRWALLGAAVVCLFPYLIYDFFYAPPFDITVNADSVDYQFTSEQYIEEFVEENMFADWMKIDGTLVFERSEYLKQLIREAVAEWNPSDPKAS